jgi:hypothetical protein
MIEYIISILKETACCHFDFQRQKIILAPLKQSEPMHYFKNLERRHLVDALLIVLIVAIAVTYKMYNMK